jgi:hypothetical protein
MEIAVALAGFCTLALIHAAFEQNTLPVDLEVLRTGHRPRNAAKF